jgi:transposase
MAHARRKFSDAVKGQGKDKRAGKAQQGLAWIQKLYRIEKQARTQQLPAAERKALRQKNAKPILDKLRTWLDASLPSVPPGTLTGKALNYLNNEWPKLIRYLEDGRLEIDNNLAENAIRPFVIGRKNFLFSNSVQGVKASANLYSLIESAKASGLEPYQYLRQVFTALPQAETVEDIENLLPWSVKKIPAEAG